MLLRFIALLAAAHAVAFVAGAAVLDAPYLFGAAVFMGLVCVGALLVGQAKAKRARDRR